MKILGIETSCDETAAAVVEDGRRVLSNAVYTQIDIHKLYGGVVPEIASRKHVEKISAVVEQALSEAELCARDLDAVAVTYAPGLIGALLSGVSFAKGSAYSASLPLIPVHHLRGHVAANYLTQPQLEPPFLALIVSGGHSHIVSVERYGAYKMLGRTTDDAAGEAFDKAARVLNIPYPGGPLLDKLAEEGNPEAYRFPKIHTEGKYDFSFSGLKTAVINQAHMLRQKGEEIRVADWSASLRKAVVDMLVDKTLAACRDTGAKSVALAGGVASNRLLRREMERRGTKMGLKVYMPPVALCTDNAVMIGSAAFYRLMTGEPAPLSLNAQPSIRLIEE